jgi:dUTP pyrophosphatase
MKIKIKKLKQNAKIPQQMTAGSSGMDVYACIEQNLRIPKGEVILVPTGIAMEIPLGFEVQIRPRSGLSTKHKLIMPNSPGTIDSDYRGELFVPLMNLGSEDFVLEPDTRIAQMVVSQIVSVEVVETEELSPSGRGEGGFGSTGKS